MAGSLEVCEGTLLHGMPYLAFGAGPPLLLLRGFMTVHANPVGLQRRLEIRLLAPLARHFRVFAVGRAPGMPSAGSMADFGPGPRRGDPGRIRHRRGRDGGFLGRLGGAAAGRRPS